MRVQQHRPALRRVVAMQHHARVAALSCVPPASGIRREATIFRVKVHRKAPLAQDAVASRAQLDCLTVKRVDARQVGREARYK